MKKANKIKRKGYFLWVLFAFLVLYSLSMISLVFWGFTSTFKDYYGDFLENVSGLPKKWTLANYLTALGSFVYEVSSLKGQFNVYVEEMYFNTIIYSVGCGLIATFVPCCVSYVVVKFRFKFLKIYYPIVIITMALPIAGSLPSEISMAKSLNIFDEIWGVWLMRGNFLGMYFLVFYAIFKTVPDSYIEAARVDGAGNFMIFLRIMLPLVKNTFFTVLLIQSITAWNEYQTPLVYLPSHPTLAMWLFKFSLSSKTELSSIPMKVTGCMLLFIPIFTVFVIFNKRLLGNVSLGGLKG